MSRPPPPSKATQFAIVIILCSVVAAFASGREFWFVLIFMAAGIVGVAAQKPRGED